MKGHIGHLASKLRHLFAEHVEEVGGRQERLKEILMTKQPAPLRSVHLDTLGIDHDRQLQNDPRAPRYRDVGHGTGQLRHVTRKPTKIRTHRFLVLNFLLLQRYHERALFF